MIRPGQEITLYALDCNFIRPLSDDFALVDDFRVHLNHDHIDSTLGNKLIGLHGPRVFKVITDNIFRGNPNRYMPDSYMYRGGVFLRRYDYYKDIHNWVFYNTKGAPWK